MACLWLFCWWQHTISVERHFDIQAAVVWDKVTGMFATKHIVMQYRPEVVTSPWIQALNPCLVCACFGEKTTQSLLMDHSDMMRCLLYDVGTMPSMFLYTPTQSCHTNDSKWPLRGNCSSHCKRCTLRPMKGQARSVRKPPFRNLNVCIRTRAVIKSVETMLYRLL